jgi:large subunit ribosomal protein L23
MALLGKTKKEVKKVPAVVATKAEITSGPTHAILRPHITEKSGMLSQTGKYTFQVMKNANKQSIARAIQVLYKITPKHVTLLNQPARNVFVRGRRGVVPGLRKAIVTVKKGDKIDFV